MSVEILLVEDNPNDAELASLAINRAKFTGRVVHVEDGVQAIDYLLSNDDAVAPRVVLLDLKLPKMDGVDVLARLKAHPRGRRIPIVMLTSSKELSDIERCYELGVNSYIVKPVDFDQFTGAMKQLGMYWLLLNQPPALGP